MQKDFHYYVTYALAKTAGFPPEDSKIIAYSSQLVDDNNEGQFPDRGEKPQFPSQIKINNGFYRPIMTQSLSVKSVVYEVQNFVYVPFHFLPGDNSKPIDGGLNKYSTTPNSPNAQLLMEKALKSQDPYRIGIAVHTYADTWSHQNFTGYEEKWNSVFSWRSPYRLFVPNIGHADVGHAPDEISVPWVDERLDKSERKINNKERALEATKNIYQKFRSAAKGATYWSNVETDFRKIINADDYDDRKEMVRAYVNEPDLRYIEDQWVDEAVNEEGGQLVGVANFGNTHWYKFQQAAKANLALVMNIMESL